MPNLNFIALCIGAFLLGSVPTGLLLGRLKGTDIRKAGSGNIGATNAFRTLGRALGVLTFLGDTLKGIPFIYLAKCYGYNIETQATLGFLAFLGHCYSPYLKFKGGKGVATGFAIFIYLAPTHALIALIAFLLSFFATGIISISSMFAVSSLFVSFLVLQSEFALLVLSGLVGLVIFVKHRANIQRLLKGEESYFNVGLRVFRKTPQKKG